MAGSVGQQKINKLFERRRKLWRNKPVNFTLKSRSSVAVTWHCAGKCSARGGCADGRNLPGGVYSLGNFSCFLSRNFSHSVNPDKNLVFSRQEFVVFRFFVQDIRERRQICRVMTMPVYMSDQQLNMTFSFVYSSITIHTSHTHTHKHKQVHTMTHNLI